MMLPASLFVLALAPMILEARLAARNERRLRDAGAVEPRDDVYRVMQVAYPIAFLAMIGEAWLRDVKTGAAFSVGAVIFAIGKALKYWAIATLDSRWTFRVLVPPQSHRIVRGPYRFVRHPNYIGVAGELAGMALMAQAPFAGVIGTVAFLSLVFMRIRIEERALRQA